MQGNSINKLAPALVAFQAEAPSISKDGRNPFFKSRYATLDNIWTVIRPLLKKHGLAVTQFPTGENQLATVLIHESGEYIEHAAVITLKDHTPQGQGSAITYMRRYALSAVLGLTTEEDDDGNIATDPHKITGSANSKTQGDKDPF